MGDETGRAPAPQTKCPKCGRLEPDHDGFGMLSHIKPAYEHGCGWCSHPGRDKDESGRWVCNYCGDVLEDRTVREELASYAHDAWAGWMKYLFSKCLGHPSGNLELIIPASCVKRWTRQMHTPYSELPEEERESDIREADRILDTVRGRKRACK